MCNWQVIEVSTRWSITDSMILQIQFTALIANVVTISCILILFICSGEAKLVMDPQMHYVQFPKLLSSESKGPSVSSSQNITDALRFSY
jgi:hypothetical protein